MFYSGAGIVGTPVSRAGAPDKARRGTCPPGADDDRMAAPQTLEQVLVAMGALRASDLVQALARQAREGGALEDILRVLGLVDEATLMRARERQFATRCLEGPPEGDQSGRDARAPPPDPRLIDRLGPARCLRMRCLPWAQAGNVCVVATSRPDSFETLRPALERRLGPVVMALIGDTALDTALERTRRSYLRRRAEAWVPAAESCRDWNACGAQRWLGAVLVALIGLGIWAPVATLWTLIALAVLVMAACNTLKAAATIAALRHRPDPTPEPSPDTAEPLLPVVSVMVPMFREPDTVPKLINRLSRLRYPRTRLDMMLVVEEIDTATRNALAQQTLPRWMRVIVVPDAALRTKPRALNYAMSFARGSIIGVYDAEDAPAPDQIRRVARHFAAAGPDLACVQGVLDYFNPGTNWLSRCFTIEYAAWFRLLLPGKQALGLVLPLGGTTLFFRRAALERLRGWDAHNVTEDADLGIRLARHGYRTEILSSATFEEANCHALPWVRQRSRWLKGYAITYAVHMRRPGVLLRQLGVWRFLGLQVQFLGTLVQVVLAPLLLSFWAVPLGLGHPLAGTAPLWVPWTMGVVFFAALVVDIVVPVAALHNAHHRWLRPWVLLLPLYFPLATLAAYKALWELVTAPHYWDKTAHGTYAAGLDRAIVVTS